MPEGDTIFLAATHLRRALVGQRITRSDFRVPRFATSDISGQTITEIAIRGKHFLFRTDGGLTLHSHVRMEGEWHLYRHAERWRGPGHEIRVVLETPEWVAVGFRLAMVSLVPTKREHEVVGHLGPDAMTDDFDIDDAERRMRAHPDREIGDILLDQRVVCGFGNAYKNELCFLRGVSPWATVRDIDVRALLDVGHRTLKANRTTGRWVTTGDLHSREGQWVFERAGKPCRRCGSLIRRARQNGDGYLRLTYWCPTCQPDVAAGR